MYIDVRRSIQRGSDPVRPGGDQDHARGTKRTMPGGQNPPHWGATQPDNTQAASTAKRLVMVPMVSEPTSITRNASEEPAIN